MLSPTDWSLLQIDRVVQSIIRPDCVLCLARLVYALMLIASLSSAWLHARSAAAAQLSFALHETLLMDACVPRVGRMRIRQTTFSEKNASFPTSASINRYLGFVLRSRGSSHPSTAGRQLLLQLFMTVSVLRWLRWFLCHLRLIARSTLSLRSWRSSDGMVFGRLF